MALAKLDIPIDYEVIRLLGEGNFGSVHLVLVEGRFHAAVKALKKFNRSNIDNIENVIREISVLKKLRSCPYIVKLLEFLTEPERYKIGMEYMAGGTLEYLINVSSLGYLCETQAAKYAKQLFRALEFMHDRDIMHRDIKPANILFDRTRRHLKLGDFGSAKDLDGDTKARSFCGSVLYMAPEHIRQDYGTKSELWSVGITIIQMLTGYAPYAELDLPRFIVLIGDGGGEYELSVSISPHMRYLIGQLLSLDPEIRPSARQVLQHPLFTRSCYKSQTYDGLQEFQLSEPESDIRNALEMHIPIYAVDTKMELELLDEETVYYNTGVYYIPGIRHLLFMNDLRLPDRLFPVTTFDCCMRSISSIWVSISAAYSFLEWMYALVEENESNENESEKSEIMEIDDLVIYLEDEIELLVYLEEEEEFATNYRLHAIAKAMAVDIKVHDLTLFSKVHRPISNLSSVLQHFGNLRGLRLIKIDLRMEQQLTETLNCLALQQLSLQNTHIEEETLIELVSVLKNSLEWLFIYDESCLQSPDACAGLWEALKHSPTISCIQFYLHGINESHLSILPDVLPTITKLEELYLGAAFEGSEEYLEKLKDTVGTEMAEKLIIGD